MVRIVDNLRKTVDKCLVLGKTRTFVRIIIPPASPIYGGLLDPTPKYLFRLFVCFFSPRFLIFIPSVAGDNPV